MPKYKEIKIDVNLSPEMILGESFNKVVAKKATEQTKNKAKESNKSE